MALFNSLRNSYVFTRQDFCAFKPTAHFRSLVIQQGVDKYKTSIYYTHTHIILHYLAGR